jgi:hypothetical protein
MSRRIKTWPLAALLILFVGLTSGCAQLFPKIDNPKDRFEALVADEPLITGIRLDRSSENDPLEPIKTYEYTLTAEPTTTTSSLKELALEATSWVTQALVPPKSGAAPQTQIHLTLVSGNRSVDLSALDDANDLRIGLVENALATGNSAEAWIQAPWHLDLRNADSGYTGVTLLVSPAATPGLAFVSAETLVKASGLTDSFTRVVNTKLHDSTRGTRERSMSNMASSTTTALPDGAAGCTDALFANLDITYFSINLPTTTIGSLLVVPEDKQLDVQNWLVQQGCDKILAPVNYETK